METVKSRLDNGGVLRIPEVLLKKLRLEVGEEVELWTEQERLIIWPVRRKRLNLSPGIVDELIEMEDVFTPEAV